MKLPKCALNLPRHLLKNNCSIYDDVIVTLALLSDEDQPGNGKFSELKFYKSYGIEIFPTGTSW